VSDSPGAAGGAPADPAGGETVWSGRFVRLEVDAGVGTIRLDRPKMNALDAAMQEEIRAAATEAAGRRDVAAVVVYGGERVFAAGADIKEMRAMSYADMAERSGGLQSAFTAVAQIPKPTVAAVTGYALGGGCELALCCDVRVAGLTAKLGQPEILLGIIPGAGGTQRLARLVGPSRAKDLIFSGRFVEADEALAVGLVDEVVPDADVYAAARARVAGYVGGPALALRAAKAAVDHGLDVDLATGLEIERLQFAALFATRDREIGMASFVEEGPGKAVFEGR
jgi:enoyl-CoA hydratase/carnithine racemase